MIFNLKYTCQEIAKAINGSLIGENLIITALSIDSREKTDTPFCFFTIKGENFDGRDYIGEAIKNGAELIVTDKKIECNVPVIYVENTVKALGMLAKWHKRGMKTVAITGSYGKTTTKDMIISVLKERYSVCGTHKNQNNEIGVPLTLLNATNNDICVVEMGMRGRGQIDWLSYVAEPHISVITSIGNAHIGLLGTNDEVFKAKTEILKNTSECAILPNEERFKALQTGNLDFIYVGENGEYEPKNIRCIDNGFLFDINDCKDAFVGGIYEHNIVNAVNAYAVGKRMDLKDEEIKRGLREFSIKGLCGNVKRMGEIDIIDDCYNASFESMEKAIISSFKYAEKMNKRLSVLLGDMLELGEKSREYHIKIGDKCKKCGVYKMYAYGKESRYYLKGYNDGVLLFNFERIPELIFKELGANDVLLVKASHKMGFERLIEKMKEMCE